MNLKYLVRKKIDLLIVLNSAVVKISNYYNVA